MILPHFFEIVKSFYTRVQYDRNFLLAESLAFEFSIDAFLLEAFARFLKDEAKYFALTAIHGLGFKADSHKSH